MNGTQHTLTLFIGNAVMTYAPTLKELLKMLSNGCMFGLTTMDAARARLTKELAKNEGRSIRIAVIASDHVIHPFHVSSIITNQLRTFCYKENIILCYANTNKCDKIVKKYCKLSNIEGYFEGEDFEDKWYQEDPREVARENLISKADIVIFIDTRHPDPKLKPLIKLAKAKGCLVTKRSVD